MFASKIRKAAAVGAGCFLIMGAGAGLASGETPEEAKARALQECAETNLCIWEGPNYTGNRADFVDCPNGPVPIQFRLGSYMNRQTLDTVASFHAADGTFQYDSTAVEDEPTDKGYDTYLVDPC